MKTLVVMLVSLMAGCVSMSSHGKDASHEAWVIYTSFRIISSHSSEKFDVDKLKGTYPPGKLFDQKDTASLIAAIEQSKIGRSTASERRLMRGVVYLAIFRSEQRKRPIFISDGCVVLNVESGDLYRLEPDVALSIIGVPAEDYEKRLCKDPRFEIRRP